ncbi:MAG: coproporphyrinogen dehydrogenase HemZ [Clostridia bacterium]|nr:coproporphyrinogen dehydrogenase HemZ [Clostridia bacterium]
MVLIIDGHKFHYELEKLCRIFFPNEHIDISYDTAIDTEEKFVVTTSLIQIDNTHVKILVKIKSDDVFESCELVETIEENTDIELKMTSLLFETLVKVKHYKPKWGVLTGIRPSKIMTKLISEMGQQKAKEYFENSLLVTCEKTNLAMRIAKKEQEIIEKSKPNSFSLYVSIPFCPTRCSYCSFVSHSITSESAQKLLPVYLDLLCEELKVTAKIAKDIGLKLETIYVGGGTPSILDAQQTQRLLTEICNDFDISDIKEFTFEAGRPDTIDKNKLQVIINSPVSRISINPQSFNDLVLNEIGRKHTAQQTIDAFKLACDMGFNDINMDIIAGLPKDDIESFKNTLDTLLELSPSSITVHTLALKRSANMANDDVVSKQGNLTCEMVDLAEKMLSNDGYIPYYMYRQSKSVGNLENVGWCKKGFEGYYNVYMMEECHTVLAVGAGAVTKLKAPFSDYIERIFNFKYPYEYNNRFESIIERKNKVYKFYGIHKLGG